MADIASLLLDFPPDGELGAQQYDSRIKAFLDTIANVDRQKVVKADTERDLLDILDPSRQSISYLYILLLRHGEPTAKQNVHRTRSLLLQSISFLQTFDAVQIRYAGRSLRELIDSIIQAARNLSELQLILSPLLSTILRIDPSAGTLTSTHLRFLNICHELRAYREALPLVEATIHSFPAPKLLQIDGQYLCADHTDSSQYINQQSEISDALTVCDVHEYFLLAGMVFIGLRRWEDARINLECVIVSPSTGSPTMLQVEAYKKWVLVMVILKGAKPNLPKGSNGGSIRNIQSLSRAYDHLAEIFASGNMARLQAEVAAGNSLWSDDANLGLVQEVVSRLPRFHVLSLQDTYSAMPLSTVSTMLEADVNAIHTLITDMVTEGTLNAAIDLAGPEPVLRFFPNQTTGPLAKSEKQYHDELVAQTERTNRTAEYARMSDRRLMLTKEYADFVRRRNKAKDAGLDDGSLGVPALEGEDEDLMMDD